MAEEKEEGEVLETSGASSVEEEGSFSSGLDNQISTIEDQLQRAQATLFELQTVKGKLEAERQHNLHRAEEEREMQEAKRIRHENERLRHELKEYHGEIGSLKDIISTLKDDLVKTAEKLESKVNRTLHSIGEDSLDDHEPTHIVHHHKHHVSEHKEAIQPNFFNDHIDKHTEKPENQTEPVEQGKAPEQVHIEQAVSPQPSQPDSQPQAPAVAEAAPAAQASPASVQPQETPPIQEAGAGQEQKPASIAEHMGDEKSPDEGVKAAVVTEISNAASQNQATAEDLLDEDLDEYAEIKRELEALESESLFKAGAHHAEEHQEAKTETIAPTPTPATTVEASEIKPTEGKKSLLGGLVKLFKKKDKKQQKDALAAPALAEQAAPANIAEAAATQQAAEKPMEAAAPTTTSVVQEPAKAEKIEPSQKQPAEVKAQMIPEKPKISALANVFKHKTKKVRGKINDGRDNDDNIKSHGGMGKLAATAAVIIGLVVITGVTYKIKNAENLRKVYTSKAQENVIQAGINTAKSDVPDEFANHDPEMKYKEAYAEYPFADTVWVNYRDPEMGITIDYPQNTSYRLKPVSSSNIWFLRRNGYLLKIEKIDSTKSLGEIRDEVTAGIKYESETVVVRGNSTIHLVLQEDLPVKGNIYLTNVAGVTYKIWYKTFQAGEDPDDEQRVKKMLDTLDFIPIQ